MKFSPGIPHARSKTCNSFRRTLLRRMLHRFSAVAPVTHLHGTTYRRKLRKSRKSFRRLLLSLFVPVSPLGAHSYKKIGGGGDVLFRQNPWADAFKISKSFAALPLPALFPVSPLLHHSYKKMGGGGHPYLPASLPSCLLASFFCPRPNPPLSKSLPAGRQALESHSYKKYVFERQMAEGSFNSGAARSAAGCSPGPRRAQCWYSARSRPIQAARPSARNSTPRSGWLRPSPRSCRSPRSP